MPKARVGFAIFFAVLTVSSSSIFIRFAQESAPSLVIAALRLIFATLMLAPFALTNHRAELKSLTRREILLALTAGFFLALHFATWTSSLEFTTVASSVVFVSTGPLWVAILSPMFLDERLARGALLGLGLALLGGTVIALSDACSLADGGLRCATLSTLTEGRAMLGNGLALVGAVMVSGYLIIGRKLRVKLSLIPYIFVVYGMSALVLIAIMFAAGESPLGLSAQTYAWIFLLALFPQLIGHSTYNWALKYISASLVAVTTLVEPIGAAILALIILGESPSVSVILGGVLILIGIYFASRPNTETT